MTNHRLRESTKSFRSRVDPEKAEELKRTKTDIENNITRILKLIKNEDKGNKDGNPEHSRKGTELVGLVEDFYKQYQSLCTLYDSLTPRRIKKRTSGSSSSSESEYFSSEEVDGNNRRSEKERRSVSDTAEQEIDKGNTEVNDPNQEIFSRERERSTLADSDEVLKTQAAAEAKEFEEQLTLQMKELESLSHQKRNLELQVESQAHEVQQLSSMNTELQSRVLELELLLKEEKGEVYVLQAELTNNENQAKSNIAELMAQINKLEGEAKSLLTQKDEMEEKITCIENEALSQRNGLTDQLDVMQQNLDSLSTQNKELEAQMERKREEISAYLIQIENLKKNLAEMSSVEQSMLEEKESFLARIKDLDLELESRGNRQSELEEKLRGSSFEINQLADENKALEDRNYELKSAMIQRGEEISAFMREHESSENEASVKAMALAAEVNDLRLELDTLKEEKNKLERQHERSQKEHAGSLEKMENLNAKLASQIDQISAKYKEAQMWLKKFKLNWQNAERKMEELAEEFRKKLEDHIRLLHRRIHVAEQLNNENKNSYRITVQRHEQENKMLGEKIASYEDELRTLKERETPSPMVVLNGSELAALNGLDLAVGKLEEHKKHVLSRVSRMQGEVRFAKEWIKKRNVEMKQLKDNVDFLKSLLDDKEEQEFLLREKVWALEAKVSKEGGEKLNLMKAVSQLEKKVGKLEKNIKEKDEDLVGLGEKKREAIRQLCFLVDFHRDRCDYLKDLISKMRASDRT